MEHIFFICVPLLNHCLHLLSQDSQLIRKEALHARKKNRTEECRVYSHSHNSADPNRESQTSRLRKKEEITLEISILRVKYRKKLTKRLTFSLLIHNLQLSALITSPLPYPTLELSVHLDWLFKTHQTAMTLTSLAT